LGQLIVNAPVAPKRSRNFLFVKVVTVPTENGAPEKTLNDRMQRVIDIY